MHYFTKKQRKNENKIKKYAVNKPQIAVLDTLQKQGGFLPTFDANMMEL